MLTTLGYVLKNLGRQKLRTILSSLGVVLGVWLVVVFHAIAAGSLSTTQAMLKGVYQGIRGLVWRLVEQYAERYGAYPTVIATGGDAPLLFDGDQLIDRIVPELTLRGIATTARLALSADDADLPR